jgi:tetratricopeptide (TPR) repeat protein
VEFIKATEADPQNKEAYHALGHLYFLRQEYLKAIEAFQNALRIDPNFSEASNYLGKSFELSGRDEEAVIAYQDAINNLQYETPQLPHWNLALLHKRQKRYEMAISELQNVRRVEPNNGVVLHEIGDTYIKMGTPALARPFYEEAAKISPNDHRVYYLLASFYLREGLSLEASDAFKKVIQLSPESDEAKQSAEQLGAM